MRPRLAVGALFALLAAGAALGEETPLEAARRILAEADRDPAGIDGARARLEASPHASDLERADPAILTELSRLWYYHGELRVAGAERLEAFDRGRELGEAAVRRAPSSADAHLWSAINLARSAEERGVLRSIVELSTVRREVAETLRLAPDLAEAHVLAGGLARHLPGFLGGDERRAEEHFRRAVALEPRRTGFRLELAELLLASGRVDEAARELRRVLAEAEPSDPLFTALRDRPRARELLAGIDAAAR